ncbi:MAG: tetratricopeptide repeat protein [Planctomycetaceae bacterium]
MSTSPVKTASKRRVLNLRAAIIMSVLFFGVWLGFRKLHARQFSRTLDFLRSTAMAMLEKEDYRSAQLHLTQYLALKSGDLDAQERLSWLLSEKIRTPKALHQAFRLNEDLLRKGMTSDDLRLRQARVAVSLNLMSDADAHLKVLQTTQADNAEVWYLSSLAANAARDREATIHGLRRSLQCTKKLPGAYVELARLADEETPDEFQPETLLARMIKECDSAEARRLRAEYYLEKGQREEAMSDLWIAMEQAPTDESLNSLLVRSLPSWQDAPEESRRNEQRASTEAQLKQAMQHFEKLVQTEPSNASVRLSHAAVCWKAGQRNAAIATLEAGIQKNGHAFQQHEALIDYLISAGETAKARRVLDSIPSGALPRDEYSYSLGRILMEEEKWPEAIKSLEQAIAFSRGDSEIGPRAQLSLAICRTRSGDLGPALETFRAVVETQPQSLPGKLGMAAAFVKAGQLDMAIATYQELTDLPGVAPYLADLMIRRNLQQRPTLRRWEQLDELLREENPMIPDPVQRSLLRADRLFAEGQILAALSVLDQASLQFPSRKEISSAISRVSGEFSKEVEGRLRALVAEQPLNPEIRAALIRLALAGKNSSSAVEEIEKLASDPPKGMTSDQAIQLAIVSAEMAITQELRVHRKDTVPILKDAAAKFALKLTQQNPAFEPELIRTYVRNDQPQEALHVLKAQPSESQVVTRAASWLSLVQASADRDKVLPDAMKGVYDLIVRHPQRPELRAFYADLLIYGRQHALAENTLQSVLPFTVDPSRIQSRVAWLLAVEKKHLPEARELISSVIQTYPDEAAYREVQARVLLAEDNPAAAIDVLKAVPQKQLSLAGHTYRVAALAGLGRRDEARAALEQYPGFAESSDMFPADVDLFRSLISQLAPQMTKSASR